MIVKLLTEHRLKFLSLKGGCRGSSESTLVEMSNCWKSHATALMSFIAIYSPYALFIVTRDTLYSSFVKYVKDKKDIQI